MALVVETGAGVTGAQTLADTAYADAYFTLRAISDWTGEDAAKEAALVRAMGYLWGLSWLGAPVKYNQPLCWPRVGVPINQGCTRSYYQDGFLMGQTYTGYWPSNEIPDAILQAQCEAALRYLAGTDMLPDLARGGQIVMKRVDIITTQYASGAPAGTRFQAVEALLRPFLKSSASVDLVRG
ncbi:DnaT-like ssDNA-binding protein [Solidesulfovibrio sp. C21]|uniref:DnaT-like ssDNA-binding protein n=1 Tax=Solidesulfovibrio sp. C21 TaxID=3398613 RepID=UPI0039FC5F23